MGMVSFSPLFARTSGLSMLLAPVQAIAALFVPVQSASASTRLTLKRDTAYRTPVRAYPALKLAAIKPITKPITKPIKKNNLHAPVQRLKIVYQFEPGTHRSCAGRLVISGRMSDVCAELDRMAG